MPGKKRKVWVWLTMQQIDVVLAVADIVDAQAGTLDALLPERGERAAFRGAITELRKVRDATGTKDERTPPCP